MNRCPDCSLVLPAAGLALVIALAACGDDAPVPVDAAPVDAPECCLPGCPAPSPECCTTPDDPRPVCD